MSMHLAILILGCLGAWLLVAGPVYQAALELREQEFDREGIQTVASGVEQPPRMSPWWWLIPPVAYFKQSRARREYRDKVMHVLLPHQVEQSVALVNKARGWLTVAIGGLFIAAKETWELSEFLEWPVFVFWIIVVIMPILSVLNVAATLSRANRTRAR